MFNYLPNEPYSFRYGVQYTNSSNFIGQIRMLDPSETFDKYERRSPMPTNDFRREYIACEYRREPEPIHGRQPQLACEYRSAPPGHLACELRENPPPTTTITTFMPENSKRKVPVGLIVGIAICIPIFIVVVLFAAIWLQEVGAI